MECVVTYLNLLIIKESLGLKFLRFNEEENSWVAQSLIAVILKLPYQITLFMEINRNYPQTNFPPTKAKINKNAQKIFE